MHLRHRLESRLTLGVVGPVANRVDSLRVLSVALVVFTVSTKSKTLFGVVGAARLVDHHAQRGNCRRQAVNPAQRSRCPRRLSTPGN